MSLAPGDVSGAVGPSHATLPGSTLTSRDELDNQLVILPMLFRRLPEYLTLDETGGTDLTGFSNFLVAHDDTLFTVPAGRSTGFDTLVRVDGQTVRLTLPPNRSSSAEADPTDTSPTR